MMKTLVLSMAAACLAGVAGAQPEDGVHWYGDYKEALEEARRTKKPIFLEFRCEA